MSLLFRKMLAVLMATVVILVPISDRVLALTPDQKLSIQSGVLFFNRNDELGCAGSGASAGTPLGPGSSVYILGDSITERAASAIQAAFQQQSATANIDASASRSLNGAGIDGNKLSGMQAITQDAAQIQQAGAIVVALGTNGGDTAQTINQAIAAIRGNNATAPIYWVDTIGVNGANFTATANKAVNAAIYGQASTDGYQVISWFKTVDPTGDPQNPTTPEKDPNSYIDNSDHLGVHPTPAGVNALSGLVVGSIASGVATSSTLPSCSCSTSSASGPGGTTQTNSTGSATQIQIGNAQIIIGVAKTEGLPESAALIGLMVGLDESGLRNLANQNVPLSEQNPTKQGDGKDGTSLGVFQQQITANWSTISSNKNDTAAIAQLMTPAYAAEAFFGSPPGSKAPSALSKGLQNVSGWQTMNPWVAAQAVQKSKTLDGSNYRPEQGPAQKLLDQLWDSSPPVPLPVAFTAGATSNSSSTSTGGCANTAASGSCNVTAPLYTKVLSVAELTTIYGNPGTLTLHPQMDANLVTVPFDVGGSSKVFSVQVNKLVAPCLLAVAAQIKSENVNYTIKQMGCYRFDSNNGTSNIGLMSYHTYGAACDINPSTNPFVGSGANVPHDMPQQYIDAFNAHGFYWGGSWPSPKDFMHFEFHGIAPN